MSYQSEFIQSREPIRVSVHEYEGNLRFDIRHYYHKHNGSLAPGFKGVSVLASEAVTLVNAIVKVIDGESSSNEVKVGMATIVIVKNRYKGHDLLDVRHYRRVKGNKYPVPTQKGISMPWSCRDSLRSALMDALNEVSPTTTDVQAESDNFNARWLEMKSQFAAREREQEEQAFMSDPDYMSNRFNNVEL